VKIRAADAAIGYFELDLIVSAAWFLYLTQFDVSIPFGVLDDGSHLPRQCSIGGHRCASTAC
jgi:hypothetical protein